MLGHAEGLAKRGKRVRAASKVATGSGPPISHRTEAPVDTRTIAIAALIIAIITALFVFVL